MKDSDQFFIYAISSTVRNYIYVGMSSDYERRVSEHNRGKEKTTKPYAPFRLFHTKQFRTRMEAREYEKFLKKGAGKRFLKALEKGR